MSETSAEELVRRAKTLVRRVERNCQGNGCFNREYEIGKITLGIDGFWDKLEEVGLFIELGEVEILSVDYIEGGDDLIQIMIDESVVERVLDVVRKHMVLEDMADV